jgi:hypothetical protein
MTLGRLYCRTRGIPDARLAGCRTAVQNGDLVQDRAWQPRWQGVAILPRITGGECGAYLVRHVVIARLFGDAGRPAGKAGREARRPRGQIDEIDHRWEDGRHHLDRLRISE